MSYIIRRYRKTKALEYDIRLRLPDGRVFRDRKKSPVSGRASTERYVVRRITFVLEHGCTPEEFEASRQKSMAPLLVDFAPRFIKDYAEANRLKHSTIVTLLSIIHTHLVPFFGRKRLDEIGTQDVQALRGKLSHLSPKTVNNIIAVLSRMLRVAVEWEVIKAVPFKVRPLKTMITEMKFYDDHEFERLVAAANKLGATEMLITLLGGEAGLRAGEILALEFTDIDFARGTIHVQRSTWCGVVGTPKGGRSRRVPMTARLASVLKQSRHLNGKRVLQVPADEANMKSLKWVRSRMKSVQRLAGLEATGAVHILRHTFCSRLAMRGRSAMEVKELAGHANLATTMRYMHLSPTVLNHAVAALETPLGPEFRGEEREKGQKNEGAPLGTPVVSST